MKLVQESFSPRTLEKQLRIVVASEAHHSHQRGVHHAIVLQRLCGRDCRHGLDRGKVVHEHEVVSRGRNGCRVRSRLLGYDGKTLGDRLRDGLRVCRLVGVEVRGNLTGGHLLDGTLDHGGISRRLNVRRDI